MQGWVFAAAKRLLLIKLLLSLQDMESIRVKVKEETEIFGEVSFRKIK